jgi:signal transduction histidine kinase
MGIIGMRERVRPFGGRVLVDSTVGEGTSLTVAVPLAEVAMAPV